MKNLKTGAVLKMRATYERIYSDTFVYCAMFDPIPGGATAVCCVPISRDAAFEWQKTTARARAGRKIEDPLKIPIGVMIADTGSGRNLFDKPLPIGLLAGRGKLPATLPTTRIFRPGSVIQITATNLSNRKLVDFSIGFIGCKIFEVGQP